MPRGGRRARAAAARAKAHGQRTDLNTALPVQSAPGQPYGSRVTQERAQQAVPMAPPPRPAPAAGMLPTGNISGPGPGEFGDFLRPTERPNEPLTAGSPSGPGPGPEVLAGVFGDSVADELRAVYLRYPTESLRELLEDLDTEL